jgi:hypothetical protein
MLPVILAVAVFAGEAAACWITAPLPAVVEVSEVIVSGRITRVARAERPSPRGFDVATIGIAEVLKGADVLADRGHTRSLPLHFPAVSNTIRLSTDLHYEEGQRGVWLLRRDEAGRFLADRPEALQKPEKLAEIRRLARRGPPAKLP